MDGWLVDVDVERINKYTNRQGVTLCLFKNNTHDGIPPLALDMWTNVPCLFFLVEVYGMAVELGARCERAQVKGVCSPNCQMMEYNEC